MRRYDQTIRQLLGESPELIIKSLTGIRFCNLRPTDHKMQMLLEREPDFLRHTVGPDGRPVVLHIEFQSGNDREMPYRMLEYYAAASRKFKQSVWQYVVYIGGPPQSMSPCLKDRHNYFAYQVIDISQIPFHVFLESSNPAVLPWAILADHCDKPSNEIIRSVTAKILATTKEDKNLQTRQLTAMAMFSSLRNLDHLTQQIIQNMPFDIDKIQNSYIGKLYRKEVTERIRKQVQKEVREEFQKEVQKDLREEVQREVMEEFQREVQKEVREEVQREVREEFQREVLEQIVLSKENMAKSMLQLDFISIEQISNITAIPESRLLEIQADLDFGTTGHSSTTTGN